MLLEKFGNVSAIKLINIVFERLFVKIWILFPVVGKLQAEHNLVHLWVRLVHLNQLLYVVLLGNLESSVGGELWQNERVCGPFEQVGHLELYEFATAHVLQELALELLLVLGASLSQDGLLKRGGNCWLHPAQLLANVLHSLASRLCEGHKSFFGKQHVPNLVDVQIKHDPAHCLKVGPCHRWQTFQVVKQLTVIVGAILFLARLWLELRQFDCRCDRWEWELFWFGLTLFLLFLLLWYQYVRMRPSIRCHD